MTAHKYVLLIVVLRCLNELLLVEEATAVIPAMESAAAIVRTPEGRLTRTTYANMKRVNVTLQGNLQRLTLEEKRELRKMNRDAAQLRREMCRLQMVSTERLQHPPDLTSRVSCRAKPDCAHANSSLPRSYKASDTKQSSYIGDSRYDVTRKSSVHDVAICQFPRIDHSGYFGEHRHRSRSLSDAHVCTPLLPRRSMRTSTELRRVSVMHRANVVIGRRRSTELGGCHDRDAASSRDSLSLSTTTDELKHCRYLRVRIPPDEKEEFGL